MAEVTNQICHEGPCDSLNVEPMQYDKFLVISLGTGSQKQEMKYSALEAAQWGILSWVTTANGGTPLIDAFSQASADMADFHISSLVRALNSEHNYLRIQVFIPYFLCHNSTNILYWFLIIKFFQLINIF